MKSLPFVLVTIVLLTILAKIIIKPTPVQVAEVKETTMPSPSAKSAPQFAKAEQVTKPEVKYTATLHTTEGDITIELSDKTPVTTNNFVFLAKQKFYDGVIFHRVIPGFMIQTGDPTGTGRGDPGYRFDDEKFTGEYKRGTVAMANAGPDTNGSQFFIMHSDYPLPPDYVIFGQVTKGLDVVDKIAAGKTGPGDRPTDPVTIATVDITE